jgi:hypothetical protein
MLLFWPYCYVIDVFPVLLHSPTYSSTYHHLQHVLVVAAALGQADQQVCLAMAIAAFLQKACFVMTCQHGSE